MSDELEKVKEPSVVFLLLINALVGLIAFFLVVFTTKFDFNKLLVFCYLLMAFMGAVSAYAMGTLYLLIKKPFKKGIRVLIEILPSIALAFVVAGYFIIPYAQNAYSDHSRKKIKSTSKAPKIAEPVFESPKLPVEPTGGGDTIIISPGPNNSATTITRALKRAQDGDTILLNPGVYFQSAAAGWGAPVTITNKKDLTIRSDGGAYVLCEKGATLPLEIFESERILIENIHFGHAGHPAQTCSGGVTWLYEANDITIKNCVLYGSGWSAVAGWKSKRLLVEGCALTKCTHQAIDLSFAEDLTFRDNFIAFNCDDEKAGCVFDFVKSKRILLKGNLIAKNHHCFKHIQTVESLRFVANYFVGNFFDTPGDIFSNNEVWKIGPDNVEDLLNDNDLWPSGRVQEAARAHLEFVYAMRKFEREQLK